MAKKITIAAAAALITLAAAACLGSSSVHLRDTVSIIAHKLFSSPLPETIGSHTVAIIWSIRIPRVLMAFLVGGALSVSGAVVQSVLRNPLASPYTLGVSSGAALGAGIIIITGLTVPFLGMYLLPFTGLIFGIVIVVAAIAFASRVDRTLSTNTIILSGLVFSLFVGAMLTLLARLNRESIERIALWHLGTFASRGFSHIGGILPFLV
ncbi:MAG: iron ABC transporter permease, partial [Clostridiales bacterium]|nr:iron ABC transporter permease [Clostridiales bacterium]